MGTFRTILITTAALMGFSASAMAETPFEAQLKTSACYANFLGTLTAWAPAYHWKKLPDLSNFDSVYTSDIAEDGSLVWIGRNKKDQTLEAKKSTPKSITQIDWVKPDCTAHTQVFAPNPIAASTPHEHFNDQDLADLLKTSPKGVIFAYSNQMHLSLNAKKILEQVSEKLKLPLLELADPESPITKGRKIESVDLINRGLTLHYPAILVYANGKITSPMMPGLKTAEQYTQFITRYLK